jgi:hypothetical protein
MQHIQKALNDEASETAGKIMEVLWRPGRRAAAEGLDTIRQYAVDLRDDADKVKAAEGILEDIEKTWPEAKEVDRLADELETARAKLKQRRESNTEYLAQTEKVAGIKRQKKEHQQILSDYLVAHFKLTGERQVLMNDETGDAREVNITAKLGRETKYQTSLDLAPGQS